MLSLEQNDANEPSWQRIDGEAEKPSNELAKAYRRAFASADGQAVLEDLRDRVRQAQPPAVTDGVLRHLEGQRYIVQWVERMIVRGMGE